MYSLNKIIFVLILLSSILGCGTQNPVIGDIAVTTGKQYTENKVLFAEKFTSSDSSKANSDLFNKRLLKHSFEIEIDQENQVKPLDPIGVIIRGVRLPETLKERRDVAVILDIVTAGEQSVTSIVAFYQRDVPGGQMLNFQDLLVYYDPEWDGVTPPWFRVRVLDVKEERNSRTAHYLNMANQLSGSLSGMVPHPVLPSVKTAIEASKMVLANKKNEVIIDFQVQFYSENQRIGSNEAITPLRRGEWLVIGRPENENSDFWNTTFSLDLKTGFIQEEKNNTVQVPYVSLLLMSADAAIPKHIMDRSQALIQLLDSSTERKNYDSMIESVEALNSSVQAYVLERRIKKFHSRDDFLKLMDVMQQVESEEIELKIPQIRTLVKLVNDLTVEHLNSVNEIIGWWDHFDRGNFFEHEDADGRETIKWKNYPVVDEEQVINDPQEIEIID